MCVWILVEEKKKPQRATYGGDKIAVGLGGDNYGSGSGTVGKYEWRLINCGDSIVGCRYARETVWMFRMLVHVFEEGSRRTPRTNDTF